MLETFENTSEIIFFIPKTQYRWSYKIDDGKQYGIYQDDILSFVKKYISKSEYRKIPDIILRHQPFLIMIQDKMVIEVHKQEDTIEDQREKLNIEIKNVTKYNQKIKNEENKSSDLNYNNLLKNFTKM